MKFKKAFIVCFAVSVFLGNINCQEKQITPAVTPGELCQKLIDNPHLKEFPRGGQFAWYGCMGQVYYRPYRSLEGPGEQYAEYPARGMGQFLAYYKITKNTEWLDTAVKYYEYILSRMDKDPDGYPAFFGPSWRNDKIWIDDFFEIKFFSGLMAFAETVINDESLKNKYGNTANSYIDLAKNCIEKWDKRGCWHEEGSLGVYTMVSDRYVEPGNLKVWKYFDNPRRSTSSFNVVTDFGQLFVRFYGVTGKEIYRDKAERIFLNIKRRFQYADDHYAWNYWEPFGIWDVNIKEKRVNSFIGLHPYRSEYNAFIVQKIADAFHHGIVFDEQDIQRIINTNLNVMWNKNMENPEFFGLNGSGTEKDTVGIASFRRSYGPSNDFKNQGELWTGLLDFDKTIRDIYAVQIKNDQQRLKRFKKWSRENQPSFKRKYAEPNVTMPEIEFTGCSNISMAAVLPHIIEKGKKSAIVCKSLESGELDITLYSEDGKEKIKTLYKDSVKGYKGIGSKDGICLITWDGTNPGKKDSYEGNYRIRWTLGNEYREFPVVIK